MYNIIALMGKAGAGKDSVLQRVLALCPDLHEIISCTTRPPRENEVNGVDYFYYSVEKFGAKVLNNEMLEATSFNDWFYGTSYDSVRSDCLNIGVFNPDGIDALMNRPDVSVQVFYINASDRQRLLRQLSREADPDIAEIIRRYKADNLDFSDIDFNYISVDNNFPEDFEPACQKIVEKANKWIHLDKLK